MRRLSFVIACGLFGVGVLTPLLAQHSGGHASGGRASYSGSGYGGFGSGVHSHSAPPGFNRSSTTGQLIYPTPIGLQQTFSGFTGINRGAIPYGVQRGNYRGRGYVGGYFAYPYYYSGFDDYAPSLAYNEQAGDPGVQTANVTANLLGDQVAHLTAEVDALRSERESGDLGQYPALRYDPPPAMPLNDEPALPPLKLVLRDGKQVQLKSYAVMGQVIWDFSAQPARRISVASVDLNASRSATEASGGEFPDIR